MKIPMYLAMTAAEISTCHALPPHWGWLACHFSPGGSGLSNLPPELQDEHLVVLDDFVPLCGHNPNQIAEDLLPAASDGCQGIILDFQHPENPQLPQIVRALRALPCPIILPDTLGSKSDYLFVPPIPPDQKPETWLLPYQGRKIWLECACDSVILTVTKAGCSRTALSKSQGPFPHYDSSLFCHYRTEVTAEKIIFTLQRTKEDLHMLLDTASNWGVTAGIGLYQELQ